MSGVTPSFPILFDIGVYVLFFLSILSEVAVELMDRSSRRKV